MDEQELLGLLSRPAIKKAVAEAVADEVAKGGRIGRQLSGRPIITRKRGDIEELVITGLSGRRTVLARRI